MSDIARLKIVLDRVKPQVLRRIEVPVDIPLDDLHLVFQCAMGWDNEHLFEFRAGKSLWGMADDFTDHFGRLLPADRATLSDLLAKAGKKKAFQYLYDFGDSWMHSVTVEAVAPAAEGVAYPRLIAAKGACPPEDIGGPWGYSDYLDAIADPEHEPCRIHRMGRSGI